MKQRKTWSTRVGALATCLVLALGTLTVGAGAANAQQITATLSPQTSIVVDGATQIFYNVSGKEVHPIVYQGSIYLPVRSISELMGKETTWTETTLTVSIAGQRTSGKVVGTPDHTAVNQNVTAQLRPDFTVVVDGTVRTFTDANGTRVYPLLYNGTTYLPLRATGELMGKNVAWNAATGTATLTAPTGGSTVTDADNFGPQTTTPPTTQPTTGAYIGEAKAKSAALAHAGLTAAQVTFVQAKLEKDDGRWEYDVEFYTANYTEYDYEIDAYSGAILSFDADADNYKRPTTGTYIGEAKAKSIALARAGLSASAISNYKCELDDDDDDGVAMYEIDFDYAGYEYEVDVNAVTGVIVKYSRDRD